MSVTTTEQNGALTSFIERAAKDESFDVAKFAELLRLQRDVGRDQARRQFDMAMSEAQSQMLPVVRDAKNTHLNNRYAKLETIDAGIRPIYTEHGFSVRFGSAPCPTEGSIRIVCTVAHDGGYFEEHYLDAPLGNAGAMGGKTATTGVQAIGSAVTYLRRYLLGMVFNVQLVDESDDDGEATRRPASNAAAQTMRRPAGVAAKSHPRFEDPLKEPDGPKWMVNLRAALEAATSREEVEAIGAHDTVGNAILKAPPAVKRDISALLAQHYARLADPDEGETGEEKSDFPGDLPPINGEEKLAAG